MKIPNHSLCITCGLKSYMPTNRLQDEPKSARPQGSPRAYPPTRLRAYNARESRRGRRGMEEHLPGAAPSIAAFAGVRFARRHSSLSLPVTASERPAGRRRESAGKVS